MNAPLPNSKKLNPTYNLIALCLSSYVVTVGFGVIMPFFPLYANELLSTYSFIGIKIGIALQIGILTSSFMFTRFLLAPSFGDLSDSSGRKPIILVGMTIYAFLLVGYGLAFDFLSLFILRALQGVASASVWPVGEALIVDTSPNEKTGRNLGYYILSMQGGMASGPFVGFLFYEVFNGIVGLPPTLSYRFTFICQGIFGILATLIVAILVQDPSKVEISVIQNFMLAIRQMGLKTVQSPKYLFRTFVSNDNYRTISLYTIYVVAVINGFSNAMIFPIITLFLNDYYRLDPEFIALTIGFVGILALSGSPLGGYLSDNMGRKKTTWISGLIRGFFYLFLGIEVGLFAIIFLFALQRFLWSIYQPSFRALQNDLIPQEVRGREFGIVQALFNLGAVIGPIIGGALYDAFLYKTFDNLIGGLSFVGAGVSFGLSGFLSIIGSMLLLLIIKSPSSQNNVEEPLTLTETVGIYTEK